MNKVPNRSPNLVELRSVDLARLVVGDVLSHVRHLVAPVPEMWSIVGEGGECGEGDEGGEVVSPRLSSLGVFAEHSM